MEQAISGNFSFHQYKTMEYIFDASRSNNAMSCDIQFIPPTKGVSHAKRKRTQHKNEFQQDAYRPLIDCIPGGLPCQDCRSPCEQIDACENITFARFAKRAVKMTRILKICTVLLFKITFPIEYQHRFSISYSVFAVYTSPKAIRESRLPSCQGGNTKST